MNLRKFPGVFVLTLLMLQGAFGANNQLQNIELSDRGNATRIEFQFSGAVPIYDVTHESEGDIQIMIYEFKECESEFTPDIKVVRPVQHILIVPSKVAGYKSTKVYVYLEKKIPATHAKTQAQLTSTFNWIQVTHSQDPYVLKEIAFRSNEENSLSVKSIFNEVPEEKFVFLLTDKKKIVVVFHNTTEKKNAMEPMNSMLINKVQTKRGMTKKGHPYTKLIFHSNQEMLMDLAEESDRFFMDFYGVSGQSIDAITETNVTDKEVVKYQRTGTETEEYVNIDAPREGGGMKWVYMGLGTGLIVGGAFAGYLYFLDEKPEVREDIEEPGFDMPPDPTTNQ